MRWYAQFARQLGDMLQSGVPLEGALQTLQYAPGLRSDLAAAIGEVRGGVLNGDPLSDSMARQEVFDPLLVAIVAAGEATGRLPQALAHAADGYEQQLQLHGNLLATLAYPTVVFLIMVVAALVLDAMLLPELQRGAVGASALPWPTRMIHGFAVAIRWGLPVLLVAVLIARLVSRQARVPASLGQALGRFVQKVPVIGGHLRDQALARICQVLSLGLASGLPLLETIRLAADSVRGPHWRRALEAVNGRMLEGADLSVAMAEQGLFPGEMLAAIQTGERTGELPAVIAAQAAGINRQMELRLQIFSRIAGPVMMLMTAGLVLTFMLGILLPIFRI